MIRSTPPARLTTPAATAAAPPVGTVVGADVVAGTVVAEVTPVLVGTVGMVVLG